MKQLRDLLSDLVERRLWPVALALVVALVAIPVVLGRGGASAPAPVTGTATADAGTAAAGAEKAEVTLETTDPVEHPSKETVRNPFKAPKIKITKVVAPSSSSAASAASSAGAAATPSSSAPAPSSSGSSTAGTSSPSGSAGSSTTSGSSGSGSSTSGSTKKTTPPKTTSPTAEDASDTYHVSLKLTVDAGEPKTYDDVARLSPLPSVTDPFFAYLGVIEVKTTHEKRAVFLVSSDATPLGDGACHPTDNDCQSVELAKGETVYFTITDPNGTTQKQYVLELTGIHKTEITSAAKASAAIARHSVAGAELLRDAAKRNVRAAAGARAYRYIPATGLLTRAKRRHVTAKAAAAGTLVPGLALVSAKRQPGMAVWRSPKKK